MIGWASKAASLLGGLATLFMAGAITCDVLLRYFLNRPLLGVDESVRDLVRQVSSSGCDLVFNACETFAEDYRLEAIRLGAAKLPVDTRFVRRVQQVEEAAR